MAQQTRSLIRLGMCICGLLIFVIGNSFANAEVSGSLRAGKLLRPRVAAPSFRTKAVVNEEFAELQLDDYKGKWLVLVFYPFDFTFVCPTEVVGVSTDSHHTHLAWIKTARSQGGLGRIKIPLLADISKQMSIDYGVLVDDSSDALYGAALRATFIIDPVGIIRSVSVNDESVGRNVEETLRLVQAFQYADDRGDEGCPANWHIGDDTVKTDPHASKPFFTKWSEEHVA